MRIITGTARGRRLMTVPGNDLVRPTPERVKEAIFSSIQFDIEGRRVLDLFAGCGQMGLEALSRGAESATFVDNSDVSLSVVRQNALSAGLDDRAVIVRSDFESFAMRCKDKFDIAFLDPPYHSGILEKALALTAPLMNGYATVFCEHPAEIILPESAAGLVKAHEYKYGRIRVTAYKEAKHNA